MVSGEPRLTTVCFVDLTAMSARARNNGLSHLIDLQAQGEQAQQLHAQATAPVREVTDLSFFLRQAGGYRLLRFAIDEFAEIECSDGRLTMLAPKGRK